MRSTLRIAVPAVCLFVVLAVAGGPGTSALLSDAETVSGTISVGNATDDRLTLVEASGGADRPVRSGGAAHGGEASDAGAVTGDRTGDESADRKRSVSNGTGDATVGPNATAGTATGEQNGTDRWNSTGARNASTGTEPGVAGAAGNETTPDGNATGHTAGTESRKSPVGEGGDGPRTNATGLTASDVDGNETEPQGE